MTIGILAWTAVRRLRVGLLLGLIGVCAVLALASRPASAAHPSCTVSWLIPVDGVWDDPAGWSTGLVPGPTDDVCVDVAGTYRVTLGGDAAIRSLTVGGASGTQTVLVLGTPTAAALSVASASTIEASGVLELDAAGSVAILDGDGTLTNFGTLRTLPGVGGFRIVGIGVTNAAGGTVQAAGTPTVFGSPGIPTVTNDGSFTVPADAVAYIYQATFVSNPGSTIDVDGSFATYEATFRQAGGTLTGNPVTLTNGSTLDDSSGIGSIAFGEGENVLKGTIPAGQTVTIRGTNDGERRIGSATMPEAVSNNGTLQLDATDSAAVLDGGGLLTNNGTIRTMGGGGFRILYVGIINASGATMELGGSVTMLGSPTSPTTNNGAVTVPPGGMVYIYQSRFVSNPGSTMQVNADASAVVDGSTFVQAGGTLTGGPIALRNASTLDDSAGTGSFVIEPSDIPNVLQGTIPPGQTVTVLGGTTGDATAALAGTAVVNDGTLELGSSFAGKAASLTGSPLTNNGTLAVRAGAGGPRYLRVALTNTGTMIVDATTMADAAKVIQNNGVVRLGDDADLQLTGGSFTNGAGATLGVTVNAATGVSILGGSTSAFLGGTLDVVTIGSPAMGATFTPVSVASRVGTFAKVTFTAVAYQATYSPTAVGIVRVPLPARLVPVTPVRILDTRTGNGVPAGRVPAGGVVQLTVAGRGGVPIAGASAVVLTVTGVDSSPGFVTAWPAGQARPDTSNLNMTRSGQTLAVQVVVPVGSNGKVSLSTSGGGHLLADVAGWYEATPLATSGRFGAVTPSRVLDTRIGTGAPTGRRGPGASITLPVANRGGVPASGASAVVLSLTAVDSSPGFVTVWPAGLAQPVVSNLNTDFSGQTIAAHVIVPLGAGGSVNLFTSGGGHLLVDVVGWFTDATAAESSSGLYVALSPVRRLDSRTGLGVAAGPRPARSTVGMFLAGAGGIPASGVTAVVANVTAVQAQPTFLTAWAGGTARPGSSNLNVTIAGDTVPNLVTAPVGTNAFLNIYTDGATHLLVDTSGYYQA